MGPQVTSCSTRVHRMVNIFPSKIEWDRIPTDLTFSKLRDSAIRYSGVFSGSVKRGSDRWRFLGILDLLILYAINVKRFTWRI